MARPRFFGLDSLASLLLLLLGSVALGARPGLAQAEQPAASDLGFESGTPGQPPADWIVRTPGWSAELTSSSPAEGRLSVVLAPGESADAPFGNLMRSIDAAPYRGRHVRLSARIAVRGPAGSQGQMWLRADLADSSVGAFDNMSDRPIRPAAPGDDPWSEAVIEVDVEPDASRLALGFLSIGGATLLVDAVRIEASGDPITAPAPQDPSAPGPLSPRALENLQAATKLLAYVRFFHPSDQAAAVTDWDHFAVRLIDEAEPATDAADLADRLRAAFAPIAPTLEVWAGGPQDAPPLPQPPSAVEQVVSWRHSGAGNLRREAGQRSVYSSEIARERLPFRPPWGSKGAPDDADYAASFLIKPLGAGVTCRLPIRLYADDEGTLPHAPADTAWSAPEEQPRLTAMNRSTRLAGVAICWGVMQHFYPYFDVVATDWDAALPVALAGAAEDADQAAYHHTLEELIAKLRDGHGHVYNPAVGPPTMIPLAFAWAGDELVVAGKGASVADEIAIGDVVLAIEDRSAADWLGEFSTRISAATDGWRRTMALHALATEIPSGATVRLSLRHPDGTEFETTLDRITLTSIDDATDHRPANGAEVAPGIVYFNLDGAGAEALTAAMPALEAARGIIFDMRGYPGDAGVALMRHLSSDVVTSARWNIPIVTLPDREGWRWNASGRWQLPPVEPRLDAPIAFLTDGRAISYAESIMGIVEAYKMGEIVGATTAGTNGNVNPFQLPGGFTVMWTGMKVLKHDGSQHHGVGIAPTVPVEPTAMGIAQGRDEVLEKAVEVLQAKIAPDAGR